MTEHNYSALVIYSLAIPGWLYVWHLLVGYDWLARYRLLYISLGGGLFVFAANLGLALAANTPDYATELKIYSYVEENAKTVAGFGLAIAIFVLLKFDKEVGILERPSSRKFLFLIFWSFLFSVVGCLPLYWIPQVDGWLTILRNLKTVPFTYSIFILAAGITVFICEIRELSLNKD